MTAEASILERRRGVGKGDAALAQQFRLALMLADAGTVIAALGLSAFIYSALGLKLPTGPSAALTVMLMAMWPLSLWRVEAYSGTTLGRGLEEYRRVLVGSAWAGLLTVALAYVTNTTQVKGYILSGLTMGAGLLLIERYAMRRVLHRAMDSGLALHNVYVVACPERTRQINQMLGKDKRRFSVVGSWLLSDSSDTEPRDIVHDAHKVRADTIVYAPLGSDDPEWTRRLGWAMEDTDMSLLVSPSLAEIAGPRLSVAPVEGLALVRVDMPRFTGVARLAKRGFDIVASAVGLLILGVPLLIIGFLIRRDSPGPAIFKQVRAGVRGETFVCWKFRTMRADADTERERLRAIAAVDAQAVGGGAVGAATFKMARDPRITRIGHLLRKYSVDELPQLVNVLKGEMSLVGPRPHPLDDVERYDDVATRRLLAKPGMTGLWQVSGRSDLSWDEAVRLDLYYVENWSLATDVVILLKTSKVVLAGTGAY